VGTTPSKKNTARDYNRTSRGGIILTDVDYRAMYLKVRDELAELQQREWVELTDEAVKKEVEIEMEYYWDGDYIDTTCARDQLNGFVRTIEAKIKEKND